MPLSVTVFLEFLAKELLNPVTYGVAFLIGAAINAAQGNGIFFSAVPYIVPLFVQGVAKASLRYKSRDVDILCQLPAERKDPAFVIDKTGRIIASEGNTKTFLRHHEIEKIQHLFGKSEAQTILKTAGESIDTEAAAPLELYSDTTGKWYQVQTKIGAGDHILIWLDEISSRKALDFSLSAIRRFSREVINAIDDLVIKNDIYDRLALLILNEGYQGVFITREDPAGNLTGYAFKGTPQDLVKSELIRVPEDSAAPIWAARKAECDIHGCVASATKSESVTQQEFERTHQFNERVKQFLGFAITNYINYAEGDVSIIAFNKAGGIKTSDSAVINTVVNSARSVTHLIDLAIGNNRMLSALELAEEVQQNLLPKETPHTRGLDIAAKSIYCNKTGGDFYDFLDETQKSGEKLNVVVGDVSGHGIAAGLLMATARALIRSRAAQPGSPSQIVTEVNRNLTLDVYETDRFITLFYLTIDAGDKTLRWVRAGHDAALLYDPESDGFEELYGSGIALGVDAHQQYAENKKTDLAKGQIIFIGTDGIWETSNSQGERFGKETIKEVIRSNAAVPADDILHKILVTLSSFRQGLEPEDDVTMVVVKITDDAMPS